MLNKFIKLNEIHNTTLLILTPKILNIEYSLLKFLYNFV